MSAVCGPDGDDESSCVSYGALSAVVLEWAATAGFLAYGIVAVFAGRGDWRPFAGAVMFAFVALWTLHWTYRARVDGDNLVLRSARRARTFPVRDVERVEYRSLVRAYVIELPTTAVYLNTPVRGFGRFLDALTRANPAITVGWLGPARTFRPPRRPSGDG